MECSIELKNVEDNEMHLRRMQKMDFAAIINDLRMNPSTNST